MILGVQWVQVGNKNRSKIDQKRRSTWEGILASIFDRFWQILAGKLGSKIDQKSIQKGIEKETKFDRCLNSFWDAIFSVGAQLTSAAWVRRGCDVGAAWVRRGCDVGAGVVPGLPGRPISKDQQYKGPVNTRSDTLGQRLFRICCLFSYVLV